MSDETTAAKNSVLSVLSSRLSSRFKDRVISLAVMIPAENRNYRFTTIAAITATNANATSTFLDITPTDVSV